MGFSLEELSGDRILLLRGGAKHARRGDEYSGVVTIEIHGNVATPKGLLTQGKLRLELWFEVYRGLSKQLRKKYGVTKIATDRLKEEGVMRHREKRI